MIFDPDTLKKYRLVFLKLRAISSSKRFYLLNIVRTNEPVSVGQIATITQMEQPIISQLLSVLRKASFVCSKAKGKEKLYSISKREIDTLIGFCEVFNKQKKQEEKELKNSYVLLFKTYKFFKELLNHKRMTILELLDKADRLNVSELMELTNQSQSTVSQNLKVLKTIGLVESVSEGKMAFYSILEEELEHQKKHLTEHFS